MNCIENETLGQEKKVLLFKIPNYELLESTCIGGKFFLAMAEVRDQS